MNQCPIVLIYDLGQWDIRKQAISGNLKKLNRYFDKMCDEVEIQIRMEQKLKRNVTQGVIRDMLKSINAVQHVNLFSESDLTL